MGTYYPTPEAVTGHRAGEFVTPIDRIIAAAERYDKSGLPGDVPMIDLICKGSSSSWGLEPYDKITTPALFELAKMGEIDQLETKLNRSIRVFKAQLDTLLPEPIKQGLSEAPLAINSPLQLFNSGSEAINGAKDLLCLPNTRSAATFENGSEVLNEVDDKLRLRYRNNTQIEDDTLFEDWRYVVEANKSRFLSFTLVSKSGTRYDDLGLKIASYVKSHNEINPTDKITLIIDAVQMLGRDTHDNVFDWLKVDGVSGVVNTGSKAPGGIAHAGFLWLTEDGLKQMQEKTMTDEEHLKILDKRGWVNYALTHKDILTKAHAFNIVRAIDNLSAINAMYDTLHHPEYASTMRQLREMYNETFEGLGFRRLDEEEERQVPSLLAFTHPQFTDKNRVAFDNVLYANGAPPGGYLHDPETIPMIRWGLNWEVVRGLIDGTLTHTQLEHGLDNLSAVLFSGLGALLQIEEIHPSYKPLESETVLAMHESLLSFVSEVNNPTDLDQLANMTQRSIQRLYESLTTQHGEGNVVFVTLVSGERSDTASHLKHLPKSVHKEAVFIDEWNYYTDEDRKVAKFVSKYLGIPLSVFRSPIQKTQYETEHPLWWQKPVQGEPSGQFNQKEFDDICFRIKDYPTSRAMQYIHKEYAGKQVVWVRGDMRSTKGRENTPMLEMGKDGDLIFYPKAYHWTRRLSENYSEQNGFPMNLAHFDPAKGGIGDNCDQQALLRGAL